MQEAMYKSVSRTGEWDANRLAKRWVDVLDCVCPPACHLNASETSLKSIYSIPEVSAHCMLRATVLTSQTLTMQIRNMCEHLLLHVVAATPELAGPGMDPL